jgi:hypothetical protein
VAAAFLQDIDSISGESNSSEEMFIDAANHGDHRGNGNIKGEQVTFATSHDDADGTGRKFAVGRCHELATGANSIVRQYRCEVCGKECHSGQALGGHMRKHRKLSPHDGRDERRSPEVNGMPNQRAAVITGNKQQLSKTTNSQYGTPFDGSSIGWL